MSKVFVYILSLTKSGVFYVGSTCELEKRLNRHFSELTKKVHHNLHLQNAWSGTEDVAISTFEFETREAAYDFEDSLIKQFRESAFRHLIANVGNDAVGGDNLSYHPNKQEIVTQRNKTQKEIYRQMTPEERKTKFGKPGERNGMFGRTHTPEVRERLSNMMMGHSFNKGIKLKPEHVEKIRARARLLTGAKNPFYGKRHSPETIEILRRKCLHDNHPDRKSISVNGEIFKSCADAARHFNISNGLVTHRLKSTKYPEWVYVKETETN